MSHLLVSPENERFGLVDAALGKMGLRGRLALTLPHMYTAPPLIASSDLIATLMNGVVDASGRSGQLRIPEPPLELGTLKFHMSWHRRNDVHPSSAGYARLPGRSSAAFDDLRRLGPDLFSRPSRGSRAIPRTD
ncbi:hypothetical protein [Rhizobium acidisoli]|uniref:hypothetical protein n=1 Tax=Rhizobium acidisoli TaxID=1538158 RepID=UPI001ABF4B16|nr:hypothetical protein [Rhizobium acidisoli]